MGGPRKRWADVVHRDALQLLGIRGWRRRTENRDEWGRLMREAKARKGLWRHIRNGKEIHFVKGKVIPLQARCGPEDG